MVSNTQLSCESNCQLPTNTLSATKKSVSFSSKARVRKMIHVNNYTQAEIDACWYSGSEMQAIRDDVDTIVKQMSNKKKAMDIDEIELLGLESRVPEIQKKRLENRIAAWDAVLDEQDMGASLEEIAEAYNEVSYQSQVAANVMAKSYLATSDSSSLKQSKQQRQPRRLFQIKRSL